MPDMTARNHLRLIREFIPRLQAVVPSGTMQFDPNGLIQLKVGGKTFEVEAEVWNAYLSRGSVESILGRAYKVLPRPTLILARYIPLPTAERLMHANVNFLDLAGNVHLRFPPDFQVTIIGKKEDRTKTSPGRLTPVAVRLLFTYAAKPALLNAPLRTLEENVGAGKSQLAKARQALVERRVVLPSRGQLHLAETSALEKELVPGYEIILRRQLYLGRYRCRIPDSNEFLQVCNHHFRRGGIRWSLTGAMAAERLQHYYHGPERSLFVASMGATDLQALQLYPDREGTVDLLRGFGEACYWSQHEGVMLAHPWLIFAELLASGNPRTEQAAAEIRRQYIAG